mgnify:CR=1 FL=1
MGPVPFSVANHRLYYRGEELLSGPVEELTRLAARLNAEDPAHFAVDTELVEAIWEFVRSTRDCSFAIGSLLYVMGWKDVVPQHKAAAVPSGKGRAA